MTEQPQGIPCTHACSWACGRTYDVIVVTVVDASTLMLCVPCLMSFSANIAKSMTEPNDPEVMEVVANANLDGVLVVTDDTPGYGIVGHSDPLPQDEFEFDGTD